MHAVAHPQSARPEPQSAAGRIAQLLVEKGVTHVFGIPGGPISPVTDALLDYPIEHVTCQHESMAVYAATGYSRATGKPGVVLVTSGPGILNALTGLAAAYQDEAPIVVLVGEVATRNAGRGALQDGSERGLHIDQMVASIAKVVDSLRQPLRVEAVVSEAFRAAMETPRGPVVLRLPVDMMTTEALPVAAEEQVVSGDIAPDPHLCAEIAALLARARRPALLAGGAVRRSLAARSLLELAELTRCPVITDIESKGVFPESHPLSLGIFGAGGQGRAARYLASEVDLLITIGARLDDTTTANYSSLLQPSGTLVQLDHDPRRLARAYQPDLMMAAHLPSALELIRKLTRVPSAAVLLGRDRALQKTPASLSMTCGLGTGGPHDPRAVVVELQRAFPADAVYSCDIGNHLLFAATHLRLDRPDQFHVSMGLGGMSSGIGTAIGLQLGHGTRRRVVGICGDGGLMMCGNELATCARYRIPLTLAVFHDGQLGMVQHGSERVYGRAHDWSVPDMEIAAYARSLGAEAIRVETVEDLRRAAEYRGPRPLLLDIPTDPDVQPANPRDETLSFTGDD